MFHDDGAFVLQSPISHLDDSSATSALFDSFVNDDTDLFDEQEACLPFSCDA
jgi:hypothetical protein